MDPIMSPSALRLKLWDPGCVQKFLTYYENYIKKHDLHLASFEIQEAMLHQPFSPSLHSRLCTICLKELLAVERQRHKLKMGEVPWS